MLAGPMAPHRRSSAWFLIVLGGCGELGLDAGGDGEPQAALTLAAIDPAFGPVGHQTPVVITGTGFSGTVTAFFGDTATAVTRVDEHTLVAATPAIGEPGPVDLRVVTSFDEAMLPAGYTYLAGGDTGETGGDTAETGDTGGETAETGDASETAETGDTGDTSGAGRVGGLVELRLVQIACPDCLGYTYNLDVGADAAFHAPTAAGWLDWLPRSGTCTNDPARTAPSSAWLDAGEWLYLQSGSVSIGLRQTDGIYVADGLDETDFVRTAAYDLSAPAAGIDLAAFTAPGMMVTPQAISTLTPVEMLYTQPGQAFSAQVSASNATFTWGPSGGADPFLVMVDVYNSRGVYLHEIVCLGPDTGTLTVPPGSFAGDPAGGLLVIGLYRYAVGSFLRPDNGSTVQTVASLGVIGTGMLVP